MRANDNAPSVNAQNQPVGDPTDNVRLLNAAEAKRQDDLRIAAEALTAAKVAHIKEIGALRAYYAEKLSTAESGRIDAIFRESSSAVSAAAAVQLAQQNTLAATVTSSAEAMRNQVAAQAASAQVALDAKIAPIQSAIADLQRFQFESGGAKQQTVEARTEQRSGSASAGMWVGIGIAALSLLLSFAVIAATVITYIVAKP